MMFDSGYAFDLPMGQRSIIKVVGVGGGGGNAVNYMYSRGIKDVEFVVMNTDSQVLRVSSVPNKLQIGVKLTEGLGAGANPEKGREAAEESEDQIRELFSDGTKMVFITAGMGGGTGTGAAPVIARIARDMGILTVGIVTQPFLFEGSGKRARAEAGIEELKRYCDTVLVILNDKLFEMFGKMRLSDAYAQTDSVLATAAKSIAELITTTGAVNLDFEDVKTVMKDAVTAVMGSAQANGPDRAMTAAAAALASPLLNTRDIKGATKVLLSVTTGTGDNEPTMEEFQIISEYVQAQAGPQADFIWGHCYEESLGDSVRVTVIATGFDKPHIQGRQSEVALPPLEDSRVIQLEATMPPRQVELSPVYTGTPEAEARIVRTLPPAETENRSYQIAASATGTPGAYQPSMPPTPAAPAAPQQPAAPQPGYFQAPPMQGPPMAAEPAPTLFDPPAPMPEGAPSQPRFVTSRATARPTGGDTDLAAKRQRLIEESEERRRRVAQLGRRSLDQDANRLDEPAYLRHNISLAEPAAPAGGHLSRYTLNEDHELQGNNKWIHDNVD